MNEKIFMRILVATIVGELALILLTTLAQEVIVDGVYYGFSSNSSVIIGGVGTFLAGIVSGGIAAFIGGVNNKWPHILLSIFIVSETSYLIAADKLINPIWFEVSAALVLIAAVWFGLLLVRKLKR